MYRLFDKNVSQLCFPGEIVELDLLEFCSRCYVIGEDRLSLYVYESFPIEEDIGFNESIETITENATEIFLYKDKDEFELIYSIYDGILN